MIFYIVTPPANLPYWPLFWPLQPTNFQPDSFPRALHPGPGGGPGALLALIWAPPAHNFPPDGLPPGPPYMVCYQLVTNRKSLILGCLGGPGRAAKRKRRGRPSEKGTSPTVVCLSCLCPLPSQNDSYSTQEPKRCLAVPSLNRHLTAT